MRKAGHHRRSIQRFELVQFAAVDDPGDHFPDVIRFPRIYRNDPGQLVRRVNGFARLPYIERNLFAQIQMSNGTTYHFKGVPVVQRVMVSNARRTRMHIRATECFRTDHFANRRFYQRRTAEENRSLILDDDRFVGHCRDVGTTRGARTHHTGDLRNSSRRHVCLIVENATEVFAIGEYVVLVGKVCSTRIDKVDAWQAVLPCNFLCAQVFLHGHRKVCATFHSRIVGDDH